MSVRLTDQGSPIKTAAQQARVVINVNRNTNCPDFGNSPLTYTINQTQTTAIFATVTATDSDAPVSFGVKCL